MRPHHQRTVDRLVALFQPDPGFTALLVAGSIAKGYERDDSDVDFLLIATPEEYERRAAQNSLTYYSMDLCDYPGGYVDGKILTRAFLEEVADHGSEPARSAFKGAQIIFSREPGLAELLDHITAYPPEEIRRQRLGSFLAQVLAMQWYVGEAEKRGDRFLLTHAVGDLVLFTGRAILAHNRILYPYYKWMLTELEHAPEKPSGLLERIHQLLDKPTKANADALVGCLMEYRQWELPTEGWPARFMHDTEWGWRRGQAAIEDV